MNSKRSLVLLTLTLAVTYGLPTLAKADRWYGDEQVAAGERVFKDNCAVCHGQSAEASPDWKKTGPDGHYPPPPLNGTAHAWHHPIGQLRRAVQEGGQRLGGVMPPFKQILDAKQIDEAIAYFQSMWNDEIYAAWESRHQGEQKSDLIRLKKASVSGITRHLSKMVPGAALGQPQKTPVPSLKQIRVDNDFLYLTQDGRYLITGDLIDLQEGKNLTEVSRSGLNLETLKGFPESDMLVYPASGKERAQITVFTDTSCPYCQKLHADIPELAAAGITVRYIPFPRGGQSGQGFKDLTSVWCAENPKQAMDQVMRDGSSTITSSNCEQSQTVAAGYQLGRDIGIRGTPALILTDGKKIDGYLTPERLIQALEL